MSKVTRLFLLAPLLAGCESWERVSAGNNVADVSIAAYNANAAIGVANAAANGVIGAAQADAMADVSINSMWAAQVPWVVVVLCLTAIGLAILYWRGRIALQQSEQPSVLPPTVQVLPPDQMRAARAFAHTYGAQVVVSPDGRPWMQLPDNKRVPLRITAEKG